MKEVHECTLSTKAIDVGLYPLRPNAPWILRVLRYLRKFFIMDVKNIKSKEFFRNKSTMLLEQKRHARSPHPFVIHPFSKLNDTLELMFFVSWFWQYFSIPVVNGFNFMMNPFLNFASTMINHIQYIVFLSFFLLGYVDHKKKEIVIKPKRIIWHYLTTFFVFDLIAVFFDDAAYFWLEDRDLFGDYYRINYATTAIATVAYFVRFTYFLRVLRDITKMFRFSKPFYYFLFHVIVITIIIHLFTCCLFSIPMLFYAGDFPPDSWLVQAKVNDVEHVPFIRLYTECVLIVFCYFFGASHQRYVVRQPNEEITLTVITVFGRLYTLFVIADLLKMFGVVGVSESKYEQYMGQLEEYMSSKNLPEDLRTRLIKYYEFKLQKRYFNESQILNTLSEHLRVELYLFGAKKLIEKASVLNTLPRAILGTLFTHMKSETFLPSDVVTRIGGNVENVYFISTGTVAVINEDGQELCHLEDGEEFGFVSLWTSTDVTQIYMHIAVETSDIYYISKRMLIDFLDSHPEILRYFENRVKKRIERYRVLEENMMKGGDDVMSSLRAGKILEKQNMRTINLE
ncbi:unnamed protein product [Phaedon cochleariae]|uniref:Cyclic nucleotide-binding domain-containing protein n=1 Tax=Phaedon cochleariae TaxID=80249 RepID=A0A9P0DR55_PHACE|nr:unnamed protein product [Phaedon cochleariae]